MNTLPAETAANPSGLEVEQRTGKAYTAGFPRTLAGLIVRPRATFAGLSRGQQAGTGVLVALLVVAAILLTFARTYADCQYFYQDQLAYFERHPEQLPRGGIQFITPPLITNLIRVGERLAAMVGSWALWSAGLYLACIFGGQREVKFGAMLKLALWSWLPYLVRSVLQGGYMLLTYDPIFNPGLAGLALDNTPPSMGQYTYTMTPRATRLLGTALSYVDIYLCWHAALLYLGLNRFTNLAKKRAGMIIAALLLLWIAIRVGVEMAHYRY
ncbi:MAG: YIP1 family protein [Anaerolineae bacterium]|nr:YIP1 family protein [Anaerolineae bacterium]